MAAAPISKRWRFPDAPDPEQVRLLSKELGCSHLVAELLIRRGVAQLDEAQRFLNPSLADFHDPSLLAGLPKAAQRLAQAIANKESITIFGDYDVDGVSSTALLVNFLREVGANVGFYIPHRLEEGYGLSMEGIEKALAAGTKVIVTVDNGVAHPNEVRRAQAGGIDVIVTDHHRIPEEGSPAFVMVNPHQEGCAYPFKILAGAGIALNLALGLRTYLRDGGAFGAGREPNMRDFLDLACLGTVADVVPLLDVNRLITHFGTAQMPRSRWKGLRELSLLALPEAEEITSGDVAFQIAPRINAGGRLSDATEAVELLTTEDFARARVIAATLDSHNKERREMERAMLEEALAQIEKDRLLENRRSLVLWKEGWHPGVIGIVAARLVDRYHRPTIVAGILEGEAKGSARSIPAYNIYEGMKSAAEHLEQFGGHAQAAGFSADPQKLPLFAQAFDENAREWINDEDLEPELRIDALAAPGDITERLAEELDHLAPFGMGNPRPVIALKDVELAGGRLLKGDTFKAVLESLAGPLDVVGFRMGHRFGTGGPPATLRADVAGTLEWNVWRGTRRLQMLLKDFRKPAD